MNDLTFLPLIPTAAWTALAAAGVVIWIIYAWRRPKAIPLARWVAILILMGLAIALPLVVLLNPTWLQRSEPPQGRPMLTILVDASQSMDVADTESGTRFEAARRAALQASETLEDTFDIRVLTFGQGTAVADAESLATTEAIGPATDLARAIAEGIVTDRPQGQAMLLLSDGIHNTGSTRQVLDAVASARAVGAPIFVELFGGHQDVRDLRVQFRAPQELAFVGQTVSTSLVLEQNGLGGREAVVELLQDGQPIAKQQVMLSGKSTEVAFRLDAPTPGLFRYECHVAAVPGEVSTVNNTGTLLLRVVDEPVRVLLLEGKPYWDTKFLIRTLSRDPSIELVSLVQMAPDRFLKRSLTPIAPGEDAADEPAAEQEENAETEVRRKQAWEVIRAVDVLDSAEALDSYQIIILGRDAEAFLTETALQQVQRWVDRGGSLVCSRGAPAAEIHERLGRLMPVRWTEARESRFRVNWTSEGSQLRWLSGVQDAESATLTDDLLTIMPSLSTTAQVDGGKILTTVLASATSPDGRSTTPVISYQPFGAGRTVAVEGAGMWRWAFLSPDYQQHEQVYHTLWQSLVRWLVSQAGLLPGQDVALRTDRVTFSEAETATASLLVREGVASEPPRVLLVGGDLGDGRELVPVPSGSEPGTFRVPFGRLPEGRYEARVLGPLGSGSAASTAFDVRRNLQEQLDLTARPDLLAALARETGGDVLTGAPPERLAERFEAYRQRNHPDRVERTTAWDRWWVLSSILGLWVVTWIIRRWQGLV